MGIVDLFRPKHRHSDLNVRAEAVRDMTEDDGALLLDIARTDRETSIRRMAIEKIEDAGALARLAETEAERSLKELAAERSAELWTKGACSDSDHADAALAGLVSAKHQRAIADVAARAARPEIRRRAVEELRDARALAELAKTASSSELRLESVARIADSDVLRGLAIDTTHKEVGLAAVDKLADTELLDAVSQKAKSKQVRQRARKRKLELEDSSRARRPAASDDAKRRRAEHAQIIRKVEALGETFDWQTTGPVVDAATKEWQALGAADDAAIEAKFQGLIKRYHQRRELHAEKVEEGRAAAERVAADRAARDAERAARDAERAARDAERDAERAARAADREARAGKKGGRKERDAAPLSSEEAAAREAAREAAAEKKKQQDAERAARAKDDAEQGKKIAAGLEAMLQEMVALTSSEDGRAIDRTLAQAGKAFSELVRVAGAERKVLEDRYDELRAKLVIRVKELRETEDWQRFANVPRAEALIKEALALVEHTGADLGARLKNLQARWKELGPIPQNKSKELWEQFKATCDQVYEKVKVVREADKAKWAEIAAAKEKLIAAAEAIADSSEWETTAVQLKRLQNDWKSSGGLPRKQGDELWKRFRAACDRFFDRRKPHLEAALGEQTANLRAKEEICARAEQLPAEGPVSGWGHVLGELKTLQRRWKEIGFVPRRDADAIYRRFHDACDAVYDAKEAARNAEGEAEKAEIAALVAEAEAVMESPDADDAVSKARAVRSKLSQLVERNLRPGSEVTELVDQMLTEVVVANSAKLKGTDLDPAVMTGKREKLIERAKELLPKQSPTLTGSETSAELATMLKSSMASRALGIKMDNREPAEILDELRDEWRAIGPLIGTAALTLEQAFDDLCATILSGGRAAVVQRAAPDAVTVPNHQAAAQRDLPSWPAATPASSEPEQAEARSRKEKISMVDDLWDVDDHQPQAEDPTAQPISPPSATELAGDGATEGDADTGWD